jgi:F-type H+-transporting ATPase subunit epsilon
MEVHIVKVNGIFWSGEADALIAPGSEGVVTILPNHVPLVTALKPGTVIVEKDGEKVFKHDVDHGILEVTGKRATVIL